jgi:hypothetical protein
MGAPFGLPQSVAFFSSKGRAKSGTPALTPCSALLFAPLGSDCVCQRSARWSDSAQVLGKIGDFAALFGSGFRLHEKRRRKKVQAPQPEAESWKRKPIMC